MYYGFFYWYIRELNKVKANNVKKVEHTSIFADMQDFGFSSIVDFLPGVLPKVIITPKVQKLY